MDDGWAAYQLDLATLMLGSHVERATADGKKKAAEVVRGLERVAEEMGADGQAQAESVEQARASEFRGARMLVTKRMKVPESGVW